MNPQPIIRPPNPYVGPMRVFPGTLIKIRGRPRYNANRFAINLQLGPSINPRDDLALHFSPCFGPPRIIRNSLVSNSWGPEESSGPMLFVPGQPFEVMFLCEETKFKIAINNAHYCEYGHRIAYEEITHLAIDGDVDIDSIIVEDNNNLSSPAAAPTAPPLSPTSYTGPTPSSYGQSNTQLVGPPPLPGMPSFLPGQASVADNPISYPPSQPSPQPPPANVYPNPNQFSNYPGTNPAGCQQPGAQPYAPQPAAYGQPQPGQNSFYPAAPGAYQPQPNPYQQPGQYQQGPYGPAPASSGNQRPSSSADPFSAIPPQVKNIASNIGKYFIHKKYPMSRFFL